MRHIPSPPEATFLMGHSGIIDNDQAPYKVHELAKKYGPIYRIRFLHLNILIVTDPAEAVRLCSRGDDYLDKSLIIYDAFDQVHGPPTPSILTTATNETWKAVRRAIAPAFTTAHLRAALPQLLDASQQVAVQLRAAGPNHPFNFHDISKRLTLEIISTWGFCTPLNTLDLSRGHDLVQLVNGMVKAVFLVYSDPLWRVKALFSSETKAHIRAARAYDEWAAGFAAQLRARESELPPSTVGGALVRVVDPETGRPLALERLKTEAAILMGAGYETTANAFTSCLVLLANHPEWFTRIEEELEELGLLVGPERREPRALTWDDLGRMPRLTAVIKETLRLMPPAGLGSFRVAHKDVKICGYTVAAGTIVGFPPYAVDNSALSYGEDAELFKPERWLQARGDSTWEQAGEDPAAAAPGTGGPQAPGSTRLKEPIAFSVGPRDCVGQALARLELQVFLAMLLSQFRLQLAPVMGGPKAAREAIVYHLTFNMAAGLWMTAEPR